MSDYQAFAKREASVPPARIAQFFPVLRCPVNEAQKNRFITVQTVKTSFFTSAEFGRPRKHYSSAILLPISGYNLRPGLRRFFDGLALPK